MTPEPRDIRVGYLLKESFSIFARAPWSFIGLALVSVTVVVVIGLFEAPFRQHPIYPLLAGLRVATNIVLGTLLQAVGFAAADRLAAGDTFGFQASWQLGLRQSASLFLTSFIVVVFVVLGVICFVIPGIVIGVGLSLACAACVIERLRPMAAIRRSWSLTSGRRWTVFTFFLAAFAIVFLLLVLAPLAGVAVTVALTLLHLDKAVQTIVIFLMILPVFTLLAALAPIWPVVLFRALRGDHDVWSAAA